MIYPSTTYEGELLQKFRMLSEDKQIEVLDFISFILSKVSKYKEQQDISQAELVVEETWGNLALDKETLKYIAEDKELEYEV